MLSFHKAEYYSVERYLYCIGFAVLMTAVSCRRAIPYWVRIVDPETGRGVPLVELRTPNAVAFWTDSNGVAVIDDPAFQDHDVAFLIHSDGYEFPGKLMIGEDSGQVLHVRPDAHDELKIRRLNLAPDSTDRLRLDDPRLQTSNPHQ